MNVGSSIDSRQDVVQPTPMARRLLWHAFSVGSVTFTGPDRHQPFEKPGAHLFWVQSGSGSLETGGMTYCLKPGRSVWIIDMIKPRSYLPSPGVRLKICGIRFGGPGLDAWHDVLGGNHQAEFQLQELHGIRQAKREVQRLVNRQPSGWEWRVHRVLTEIMGQLLFARRLLISPQADLPKPVLRVLDAVSSNPDRDWKARELARVARVSYSSLRQLFRATQQETLHSFLQRHRADRSRQLLADPQLSIKEVAEHLSFSSEFYFSHFFRKNTGMSPSQFRQQLKESGPTPRPTLAA